jgi:hypothetical protein
MYRDSEQIDGKSDGRIPYLLKLPGQKAGATFTEQFSAVMTADLLLDVVRGQVRDASDARAWFDRNGSRPLGNEVPAAK